MPKQKKTKATVKPAIDQTKTAAELDERDLQKVSGGSLMEACTTGKHIPEVKI